MCGICGYLGYDNSFSHGYLGILKLLNRGYDSVGVTTINKNNKFMTHKYASDNNELADTKILKHQNEHDGSVSILHSRWRTVGDKTDANSHPHLDMTNTFSLVHNGIIENYIELKKFLMENGYTFRSETDSEVIVNLISYYYTKNKTVLEAIQTALSHIEGTYALCVLCIDSPNILYCMRHGSPLLVGISKDMRTAMVVSESYAFNSHIDKYFVVENSDIIILTKEDEKITIRSCSNKLFENNYKINNKTIDEKHSPEPYDHWTLKEINEQVISCNNATNMGGRIVDDSSVILGGLTQYKNEIISCDNLLILGCGTSYHAGLLATKIYKNLCDFKIMQLIDASEFTYSDIPKYGKTCAIFISQSGETKDLHRCLEICNKNNIITIGVVNVVDSLIAREVKCGVYLNCGREFAVASTKAFSSQVVVLTLIGIWFSQNMQSVSKINKDMRKSFISRISNLGKDINKVIKNNTIICKEIANYLYDKNSIFILGKDTMEPIAKEGSLKLKEIGYIHAEGYSSSALKHGPYALLDNGFPVILLTPYDEHFVRNQGILDELKSRGSYVIGISDVELNDKYDKKIIVPKDSYLEITFCVVLQLISYYLSIKKNINPDFPRNLSKTVSVD
jgi:glucosamine--fructose-6-phosphate aminotransferase (isomerizing)